MLELLLAPEEDDDDMARALCTFHPTEGVTVLGRAVAWGYDDGLAPLLAAARCLHQPVNSVQSFHAQPLHAALLLTGIPFAETWCVVAAMTCPYP